METIEQQCVTRGEALLDAKAPGWDAQIDLSTLNLMECHACVVGQLAGASAGTFAPMEFADALGRLGLRSGEAGDYGFNLHRSTSDALNDLDWDDLAVFQDARDAAWDRLTEAWRERIAQRRLARLPQPELVAV